MINHPNRSKGRYPRIVAEVSTLPHGEARCTCCNKPLTRKFAWLELDQRIDAYHDFGDVPAGKSQGWFPFGLGCAKALNKTATDILDNRVA